MTRDRSLRIDKWLWATRVFKTRSQAKEACIKGKVLIGDIPVKPSRLVTAGEIITVKKMPVIYSFRIKELLSKRISAKLTGDFLEDLTPEEELAKLQFTAPSNTLHRKKGTGRPTKKERRIIPRSFLKYK